MAKIKNKIDNRQIDIFSQIEEIAETQKALSHPEEITANLDIDAEIREWISAALKKMNVDRFEVAARLSRCLKKEISKSKIDSWSAESKENHCMQFRSVLAFIAVTGDKSILYYICKRAGGFFIENPEEVYHMEMGKLQRLKQEIREREKQIQNEFEKYKKNQNL